MRYSRGLGLATLFVLGALAACADPLREPEAVTPRYAVGGSALVPCAGGSGEAVEGALSVSGGTVANARHALSLPLGAVVSATKFRVTEPKSRYLEVNIKADGREGFAFAQTATITIDYSRCDIALLGDSPLYAWKIDPETKALIRRMPSVDDRLLRQVTFTTDSLSSYSIAQ